MKRERTQFPGFDRPESNFFRMPNSWTDITAEINNIAELKVVEYILRHTWGYQEYGVKKHITIDEFVHGRRRQDGSRIDKGTGLSERAVYDGLRKAVENGLVEEEVDDTDRGRVKKFYSVRMAENPSSDEHLQSLHPTSQSLHPYPAKFAPRTEKETLERQEDLSNFERSHRQLTTSEESGPDEFAGSRHALEANRERPPRRRSTQARSSNSRVRGEEQRTNAATRIRDKSVAPAETDVADRAYLQPFLEDFARELGDEAPLSSSITRTLNIFSAAVVPVEQWDDLLYQARALTQEHTGQIRKVTGSGEAIQHKNKMPYFFATLEQLVGLRPVSAKARSRGESA